MDTSAITTFEQSYEAQCDNYKKQIYLLQDKIAYYDRDYHQNNLKLKSRLKEIEERDYYLQREINLRDNQLETMSELLKEKTTKVSSLENAIDQLNNHSSHEKNKLYSTIATERDQISSVNDNLKEEIASLHQIVSELTEDGNSKAKEIHDLKEDNELYNNDNSVLIKKVQEYEESYSGLLRERSTIENNLKIKLDQCVNYEKQLLNYEREIESYTNDISNEIKTMTQWVETYFGSFYPSTYDIPSLITGSDNSNLNSNMTNNHKSLINISIDQFKKTLETSRIKIIKEQNTLEAYNQRQKCEINDLMVIRDKKQYEINGLRTVIQEIKEQNLLLQIDNENYLNELIESKQVLAKLNQSLESIANENDHFLSQLYSNIKNELDAIMKDHTFIHYSQIILKNSSNSIGPRDVNSRQYLFEDVLDRLLHFIGLLKEDYKDLKKEHYIISNESLNKKGTNYQEMNELNAQISALKSELSNIEISLSKTNDENMLLMSQVTMLENTIQGKEDVIAQLKKDIQNERSLNK